MATNAYPNYQNNLSRTASQSITENSVYKTSCKRSQTWFVVGLSFSLFFDIFWLCYIFLFFEKVSVVPSEKTGVIFRLLPSLICVQVFCGRPLFEEYCFILHMLPYTLFLWACPIGYFGHPLLKAWLKAWSIYISTSLQYIHFFIHFYVQPFVIYCNLFIAVKGTALARSVQVHHNLIKHTAYEMSILYQVSMRAAYIT